jgi:hypothetical protein
VTSLFAPVCKLHRCIPVREQNPNTEAVNQPRCLSFSVAHTDYDVAVRVIETACSCRLQYEPSLLKCPNSMPTPKSGQILSNSVFIILRPCKLLPWKVGLRALLLLPVCCPPTDPCGLCWHPECWKGSVTVRRTLEGVDFLRRSQCIHLITTRCISCTDVVVKWIKICTAVGISSTNRCIKLMNVDEVTFIRGQVSFPKPPYIFL